MGKERNKSEKVGIVKMHEYFKSCKDKQKDHFKTIKNNRATKKELKELLQSLGVLISSTSMTSKILSIPQSSVELYLKQRDNNALSPSKRGKVGR